MPIGVAPTGMGTPTTVFVAGSITVDVVTKLVCNIQEPVVGVEGNANWNKAHVYGVYNKPLTSIGLRYLVGYRERWVYCQRHPYLRAVKGKG